MVISLSKTGVLWPSVVEKNIYNYHPMYALSNETKVPEVSFLVALSI
jgi:hypothetical protein